MNKLFNKIKSNIQIIIKKIKFTLIITIVVIIIVEVYSLVFEQDKIAIDRYNFEQLEKVKKILRNIPREEYKIRDLKDFNIDYKENIKPIKNCYYIASTNYFDNYPKDQEIGYIFGFKLESVLYKIRYLSIYYAYPKYDLPYTQICDGTCYDHNRPDFEYTISNPCQD